MSLVDDAEEFVERASEREFAGVPRRETQNWMFRVRRELEEDYDVDVEGREHDYVVRLVHDDGGHAEFVVDSGAREVEAYVRVDGDRAFDWLERF
ncbi:MAG: hypothetical protein ACLFMT_04075 [Halobacteriales archaeon]